jgi:hypothetical protein
MKTNHKPKTDSGENAGLQESEKKSKLKVYEIAQVDFITEQLRAGKNRIEIWQMFGNRWPKLSERTFFRRYVHAKDIIDEEAKKIQAKLEEEISKEVLQRKKNILSPLERREWLTKIVRGKSDSKEGIIITTADRINAIKELNKMDGDYAPTKNIIATEELKPPIINIVNSK